MVAEMMDGLGKTETSETSLHNVADVPLLWTAFPIFLLNYSQSMSRSFIQLGRLLMWIKPVSGKPAPVGGTTKLEEQHGSWCCHIEVA